MDIFGGTLAAAHAGYKKQLISEYNGRVRVVWRDKHELVTYIAIEYGSLTAIKKPDGKPRGEEREDAGRRRSPLNYNTTTGSGGPTRYPGLLFGAIIINFYC